MTSIRIAGLLAILCSGSVACSEHRRDDDVTRTEIDGSQMSDAATSDARTADGSAGETEVQCTIAYRLDTCCYDAVAVTRNELLAEPCLLEYPEDNADIDSVERCMPDDCAAVSCGSHRPPSYLVAPSTTGCAFVDECDQPSDCVLATEVGVCCACPQAMPASVAVDEACFIAESEDRESSASCPFGCFSDISSCEACPARVAPTCVIRDGINICQ